MFCDHVKNTNKEIFSYSLILCAFQCCFELRITDYVCTDIIKHEHNVVYKTDHFAFTTNNHLVLDVKRVTDFFFC